MCILSVPRMCQVCEHICLAHVYWLHCVETQIFTLLSGRQPYLPLTQPLRSAWCLKHGKEYNIQDDVADIHVAGTPCTAHSPIGLQEEEQSRAFAFFIIWLGQRKKMGEPVIIQENVTTFPISYFTTYLPEYEFVFTCLNPMELGWPVHRNRQWILSFPVNTLWKRL